MKPKVHFTTLAPDEEHPEYSVIQKLVNARMDSGYTQKELAERCDINQSNISRLERGRVNPTLRYMMKLAEAMDLEMVVEFRPAPRKKNRRHRSSSEEY